MTGQPASDPFQLPRLSRARTRPREGGSRWSQTLAQVAFAALVILTIGNPWMTEQPDERLKLIREVGYVAILLLALVAMRPWRHPERLLVVPWPLLLALGWCWLSLVWAIEPGVGLRRLVLTSIVLWTLFALIRELGLERPLLIVQALLALLLVVNFTVVLADPTLGIHGKTEADLAGDWRGIMEQKNYAGFTSAMTVLLFAFDTGRWPMAARIGICLAAAMFLFFSDSATSMGIGAAALIVGGLLMWRAKLDGHRRLAPPAWAWLPLGLLAVIFVAMAINPEPFLELVSDPAGFTGRNQIWTALINAYADRPLSGLGYGSLWDLGPDGPITAYARDWVAQVSQGHNGYLDLLVQIGALGTLLVLFATLTWPIQLLLRGGDQPARVLGAVILLFCLGHNSTESTLFDRDALGQVFLMIGIALLWNATAMSVHATADGNAAGRPRTMRDELRRRRSRSAG
jgi:O-antigen ligase